MTPTAFREALELLDWSQRGLARLLRRDERTVRRWASGDYPIPLPVAAWLALLAQFHAQHPPPREE